MVSYAAWARMRRRAMRRRRSRYVRRRAARTKYRMFSGTKGVGRRYSRYKLFPRRHRNVITTRRGREIKTRAIEWSSHTLRHNKVSSIPIWYNSLGTDISWLPQKGTGSDERIGAICTDCRLICNFEIDLVPDAKCATIKAYLVPWSSSHQRDPTGTKIPFQDPQNFMKYGFSNISLDTPDYKAYPGTKYIGTFGLPKNYVPATSGGTSEVSNDYRKLVVPIPKRLIINDETATLQQVNNLIENMSLVFVPYNEYGTATSEAIGFVYPTTKFFWTDP